MILYNPFKHQMVHPFISYMRWNKNYKKDVISNMVDILLARCCHSSYASFHGDTCAFYNMESKSLNLMKNCTLFEFWSFS